MALPNGTAVAPRAGSAAKFPVPTLDPTTIPKYVTDLVIPPVMPKARHPHRHGIDRYVIGVRQFSQQVLPPTLPSTTVWGYGSLGDNDTFNYPSFTIEARVDRPVRVTWVNDLVDSQGRFLPHLLAVDPTLHWANPPGGRAGRDSRPTFTSTPGPYTGPVPIVTHLHGGHSTEESDGYAEAWYLPRANNIPPGFATVGSFYNEFREKFADAHGLKWEPGTATFQYANDQRATTVWFHDHTLGMTRLNVYAGPAGFYLLRGGEGDLPKGALPGPAPSFGDPPGTRYHEIPLAIQDRSFNSDGSLFYPTSREFFDGFAGPYIPTTDVPPIWNPEFFANTIVVNGRTWPKLEVEPRRYRLRFLNGCNARFLILKIADSPTARPSPVGRTVLADRQRRRIPARTGAAGAAAVGQRGAGRRHRRLHRDPGRHRAVPHQRGRGRTLRPGRTRRGLPRGGSGHHRAGDEIRGRPAGEQGHQRPAGSASAAQDQATRLGERHPSTLPQRGELQQSPGATGNAGPDFARDGRLHAAIRCCSAGPTRSRRTQG